MGNGASTVSIPQLREDQILQPGSDAYNDIRQKITWNQDVMGDALAILLPETNDDVANALQYCAKAGLPIAVNGGGHSQMAMPNKTVVLSLTKFNQISVDPKEKTLICGGGCRLGDVDAACGVHGLATTFGTYYDTGVGGLTLGCGVGILIKKFGLALDNLLEITGVTPAGITVIANEKVNSDLFWACRGGGGNFCVVTEFKFQLHNVGGAPGFAPGEILSGPIIMPQAAESADSREEHLKWWFEKDALPNLAEKEHYTMSLNVLGGPMVVIFHHYGAKTDATKYLEGYGPPGKMSLKEIEGNPLVCPKPYKKAQEPALPGPDPLAKGGRFYYKAVMFPEYNAEIPKIVAKWCQPTSLVDGHFVEEEGCAYLVGILPLGGKFHEVPPDATAFCSRGMKFWLVLYTLWQSKEPDAENKQRQRCVAWAKGLSKELEPFGEDYRNPTGGRDWEQKSDHQMGGVEMHAKICQMHGAAWEKLKQVKAKYDPKNLLSMNQNVPPEA
eukprot:gnl/MRDRNA2_/MRDRNA2_111322_c0_seq1.p1 gnl/MRDRNA2_/MRDRNA2_111322_c0~~gnl/MRDRNA2_/MRDRNA2_111322_c0_seq1.p1  ORF type:complete len:500 (+),score=110.60 gnl/MRDRNA2_/MRDRNA2_111322_c0_seq1:74-1573(+)